MDFPDEVEERRQYDYTGSAQAFRAKPVLWKSRSYPLSRDGCTPVDWTIEYEQSETEDSEVDEDAQHILRIKSSRRCHQLALSGDIAVRASKKMARPAFFAKSPSLHTVDSSTTRPSVLKRLKSSISMTSTTTTHLQKSVVCSSDLRGPSEVPEIRFIDSAGVVIPGVCDRMQCTFTRVHFVSAFHLSEPLEYTTALAEHGITYSEYVHLIEAMQDLVTDLPRGLRQHSKVDHVDRKPESQRIARQLSQGWSRTARGVAVARPPQQQQHMRYCANMLNRLLDDISNNLRARGVPVVICVSSFPLFASEQYSDVQVQILHVPFTPQNSRSSTGSQARVAERLSFVDLDTLGNSDDFCVPAAQCQSIMDDVRPSCDRKDSCMGHQVCPWPIWPNAIPSRRRRIMAENAERYGIDPYFREWLRASFDSRTACDSYDEYLAERKRSSFSEKLSGSSVPAGSAQRDVSLWRYQRSRQLELRRDIERGFRLRLVRFSGCGLVVPPHNPELDEAGLSKRAYEAIVARVCHITHGRDVAIQSARMRVSSVMQKICQRKRNTTFLKLQEYVRELNSAQQRIIWTVEAIVDEHGHHSDWEISAWNGEDPLELLIDLEGCGIVEKRLTADD